MKKKSGSRSAFFNLRVLIGLCLALAGVALWRWLGLVAFAAKDVQAKMKNQIVTTSIDPSVPAVFDCSKIQELGIDKQENMRAGAIMIACGAAEGGFNFAFRRLRRRLSKNCWRPWYGGADVDLITGTETSPNITQSETFTCG